MAKDLDKAASKELKVAKGTTFKICSCIDAATRQEHQQDLPQTAPPARRRPTAMEHHSRLLGLPARTARTRRRQAA